MASCYVNGGTFEITKSDIAEAIADQTASIAEVGGIAPIRFCHWAAPEWGDAGETWEKNLYNAALIAVATINTIAQLNIANKQYNLAKDYVSLSEDRQNRFKNDYAPFEQAMLFEANSAFVQSPNYTRARADGQKEARNSFASVQKALTAKVKEQRLCMNAAQTRDYNIATAVAIDNGSNYNYRDAENYAITKNDQRWNRRSNLLNLGRDLHAQSAAYAQVASTTYAGLSNLVEEGTQGAISLLGYLYTRQETAYPSTYAGSSSYSSGGSYGSLFTGANLGPSGESI